MKIIERVEAGVIYAMIVMLLVAIILGTVTLGRLLGEIVVRPPLLTIEPAELFASFGLFLIVVIGLELLKVLKLHLAQGRLRPELATSCSSAPAPRTASQPALHSRRSAG